ncbi:MAG: hypothetical protein ACP6IQ_01215 [Candidatus Njordarchaeia archaeon]
MSSILRYFKKKIFGFYLRRLVKKWCEETDGWKRNDWINYLKDRFEEKKKTRWTRLMFPKLMEYTYEELDSYPVTYNWPIYPSAFPVAAQWSSTGTIKKKLIKVTKEDILDIIKGVGRLGYTHIMREGIINKELLLHWGEEFASGNLMKLQVIWSAKKALVLNTLKLRKEITKVKEKAPFDLISCATLASLVLLLRNIDFPLLKEGGTIVSTGDVLSPSIEKFIRESMERIGTTKFNIYDYYGSSETILIAGGFVSEQDHKLAYFPDILSLRLMKSDGKIIDIFSANKGDVGLALPTILTTLTVPNYKLGDIIEVVDTGNGKELPKIRVLGRESFSIEKEHPELGEIRGISGATIKILGTPVNTYALDELLANKLKLKYLSILEISRSKGRFIIYTDKKTTAETILEAFKSDRRLTPIYQLYEAGLIDLEVIHDKSVVENYEKLFLKEKEAKPFIPRAILNVKI